MADNDAEAITRLLPLLPVPALVFDDGCVEAGNEPALTLLRRSLDELRSGFRDGLRDEAARAAFDALHDHPEQHDSPVVLKWGREIPTQSLAATAQRLDDHKMVAGVGGRRKRVLVILVDDDEAQRLDGVINAFENGLMLIDEKRRLQWLSRGTIDTYGIPYPMGTDVIASMHPEDVEIAAELFKNSLANPRRKLRCTTRVAMADFPDVWWKLDVMLMNLLDDPAVGAVVSTFGPHAETPNDDEDVLQANRISEIMPAGIISAMIDGRCYYRNRLAQQQLGVIPLEESALGWLDRVRPSDRDALRSAADQALEGKHASPVVAAVPQPSSTAWYRFEFIPQFTTKGHPAGWTVTSLDITAEIEARQELQRAQDHLWHLANHDALTGLPNRPAIMAKIDTALTRAARESHGVALLYCDLDGFKPVNDEHGHEAGDHVLLTVGQRMQKAVRETDAVGRIGGDEFIILCESFSSTDDVMAIAKRVERDVAEPISVGASSLVASIGVTVGIAIAEPGETSDALLSRADAAMYERKSDR